MVDDNDWIDHDGGPEPKYAESWNRLQVRFRDGAVSGLWHPMTAGWWGPNDEDGDTGYWVWDDELCDPDDQIVAYRVVKNG